MARKPRSKKSNTSLSKKQQKEVRKIALKAIDDEVEDKRSVNILENVQLFHNKPLYVSGLLSAIQQGEKDGTNNLNRDTRIGDRISLKNINVRFWLSNKLDRPNVMYKGVLYWYPVGVTPADAVVYFTQTNKMLDRYNDKQITIIDQFIVKSHEMYDNGTEKWEHSYLATLNKSYKSKKVEYATNSTTPGKMRLGFALVCYDAFGTAQTDNIASCAYNIQLTYQDA